MVNDKIRDVTPKKDKVETGGDPHESADVSRVNEGERVNRPAENEELIGAEGVDPHVKSPKQQQGHEANDECTNGGQAAGQDDRQAHVKSGRDECSSVASFETFNQDESPEHISDSEACAQFEQLTDGGENSLEEDLLGAYGPDIFDKKMNTTVYDISGDALHLVSSLEDDAYIEDSYIEDVDSDDRISYYDLASESPKRPISVAMEKLVDWDKVEREKLDLPSPSLLRSGRKFIEQ